MAEMKKNDLNPDFSVDLKKDKKLLSFAEKVYKNPRLLAKADIAELSPDNPALASKILLSAYTRSLMEEARMISNAKKDEILKDLLMQYKDVVDEFLAKNKTIANHMSQKLQQSQKGGA